MLRHLLTILIVFNFFQIYSQDINWLTLDKAIELQKKNPKNIIMDVYTNWCGPCKLLDRNTFKNKDVSAFINKHFYAVKFNAEGNSNVNYDGKVFTNPNFQPIKQPIGVKSNSLPAFHITSHTLTASFGWQYISYPSSPVYPVRDNIMGTPK